MFWCLNSTELFERPFKSGWRPRLWATLLGFPGQLRPEHQEIVGDDEVHLLRGPVPAAALRFLRPLLLDREAQLPEHEVRLARGLAAAELLGREDAAEQAATGETDNGLGRVASSLVDQLVAGRRPEGMSTPASRSASAWRTCSRLNPLGTDWGIASAGLRCRLRATL